MKQNFQYCLSNLLKDEGGYTNDPHDKGGPTNFGITLGDYRRYIDPNAGASDVKGMTVEQAKLIYKTKYWDQLGCDNLPSGLDYTMFDYGVNSGLGRPRKIYAKLIQISDPVELINKINDERLSFLKSLSGWKYYGKGWGRRVADVRAKSLKLNKTPPKASTVATGASTATVATGAAAAAAHHWWTPIVDHWHLILGGITALALVTYLIYSIYEYRKNKHV